MTFSLNAVAVGISYIVYSLLIHLINDQERWKKVRDEIDVALESTQEWTKETFEKLEYTMLCIKETLRLGAPFTFMPELEVKEDVVIDGISLHKDTLLYVDIPYM